MSLTALHRKLNNAGSSLRDYYQQTSFPRGLKMDAGWKLRFSSKENNNAKNNTPPQVFMVNQDIYDEHGFRGDPSWGKTEALEDEDEDLSTMEKKPVNEPTDDATKQPLTRMMT